MSPEDPLLATLLDFDVALNRHNLTRPIMVGGGYGLYLKQQYLRRNPQTQTLFPLAELPPARTTKDIDLILRAEIATDSHSMKIIRGVLDELGFQYEEQAKFTQFTRKMGVGSVKIDLLAGPLGEYESKVEKDSRRVKPKPKVELHASKLIDALGVEENSLVVPVEGLRTTGESHAMEVRIPQAFSYTLMKLMAFRDQVGNVDKNLGAHHAVDLYRIIGLLTRDEDEGIQELIPQYRNSPVITGAMKIVETHFSPRMGLGWTRILEHPDAPARPDQSRFVRELRRILGHGD